MNIYVWLGLVSIFFLSILTLTGLTFISYRMLGRILNKDLVECESKAKNLASFALAQYAKEQGLING